MSMPGTRFPSRGEDGDDDGCHSILLRSAPVVAAYRCCCFEQGSAPHLYVYIYVYVYT